MKINNIAIGLSCALILTANPIYAQSYKFSPLKVGDKAPPLEIQAWFNGKPENEFKKGHVYIVEFGFISCTPCRNSIPHLTKLAKQYKNKLSVIGVHIWENIDKKSSDLGYVKKVENFVDKMGVRMNYTIAVDVPGQATAEKWKIKGAPTTFLIDQFGVIAWIGVPNNELDTAVKAVLGFDTGVLNAANHRNEAWVMKEQRASQALGLKDYQTALKIYDSLIQEYPNITWIYSEKYMALRGIDSAKSSAWLQWMMKSNLQNYDWLHLIFRVTSGDRPNYDQALSVADLAFKQAESESVPATAAIAIKDKGVIYFMKGDLPKTIENFKRAIDYLKFHSNGIDYTATLKEMEEELTVYEKKLR